MKISYYAVYGKDRANSNNKKISFKDIVNNIIKKQNSKNKGNNLPQFISHVYGDVYIFVKINDSEILKTVNTSNLSVGDIQKLLKDNEKLGFASYFIIKDSVVGYGCSLFSSKINRFGEYVNENYLLKKYDDIMLEPLMAKMTKADALNLKFIGKTTVRLEKSNNLFQKLSKEMCFKGIDEHLIDGLEITIKPSRGKDIKEPIKRMTNNISNDVEMIKFLAKEHLADQAREIFLDENNILSDVIKYDRTGKIPSLMETIYKKSEKDILDKKTYLFKKLKI